MNKRQKGVGEFVVARGDASELLEACEETLDQIAGTIEVPIERARCQAIGSGGNHDHGTRGFDRVHEMVGVVALVRHHGLSWQILDQRRSAIDIGNLSGRKNDAQRIPQGIDSDVQFGGQSAARAADFLTARFFFGRQRNAGGPARWSSQ